MVIFFLLASCGRPSLHRTNGYIEGRYTYVSSGVSGILQVLAVSKGRSVNKGQLLFQLESQPESDIYKASVENLKQSIASRDAIAANLVYARQTYERYKILVPQHAIQQSVLDEAKARYVAQVAQLSQANATIAAMQSSLAQSKWTMEQKTVVSPIEGMVFDTYYEVGENTEARKPILSLLPPTGIKAVFYVEEPLVGALKINQVVRVYYSGSTSDVVGKIAFISPTAEYTPPVIYSTETNMKLSYRIEAVFPPQEAFRLHPGQPISVLF
jgi:HlyD family secretion protein